MEYYLNFIPVPYLVQIQASFFTCIYYKFVKKFLLDRGYVINISSVIDTKEIYNNN